ncbi:putative bifunctional diguanylate cyclase/phosphodiesterase [Treponema porcinum]|uniref:putative bifunctional diguanylate cyclase/phosphodiesterase n=1 Tax=Treponema porcinum TaxID=261392 RepID=UPI0023522083|nr:bifunctional diguanylate cyclase/phosphodiesterase [Treponema porcinum]MCI6322559.1 bifunctional diguanylate cyclase/phosphodiesterase [Treponema porcinum]MCI6722805.1 bifunctional diguanylate cyclase/phosphodiesterase [Treponema porcinum]
MSIMNSISSPVIVARPIILPQGQKDFELVFFNEAFSRTVSKTILKFHYFHEFKALLSTEVPWNDMADKAINKIPCEPVTYFSDLSNGWFRVQMKGMDGGYIVVNIENITKEREHSKKLLDTAYIDILTGLYNRNKFIDDISELTAQAQFNGTKLGLLLIDIDNMKIINDYNGHTAGDEVLKKSAEILKRFSKNIIKAYRFGGDEFLLAIKNCSSMDSITNVCDTVFESFNSEQIKISGGIAVYPDDSEEPEDLLRFTDIAMRHSKKDGKNRITNFKLEMQRVFIQKLNMQAKMSSALINKDFYLVYQPQFDIKTGDLRGFEALMRWYDKELGDIGPAIFIPLAEETGMILEIGDWVLNTAFCTLKNWQQKYSFKGIMSINISPMQLKQPNFIENIRNLLIKYNLNPDTVEIEITEGIMIENMNEAIEELNSLKNIGLRISLDDFGTGYSSLSYLQVLPLNTLKIDKSFITGITEKNGIQANITNSIITMVTKMGLQTIAEGVEKNEQLQILKEFNCHIVQGFLRGKPMPEQNCAAYLGGKKSALISLETEKS